MFTNNVRRNAQQGMFFLHCSSKINGLLAWLFRGLKVDRGFIISCSSVLKCCSLLMFFLSSSLVGTENISTENPTVKGYETNIKLILD